MNQLKQTRRYFFITGLIALLTAVVLLVVNRQIMFSSLVKQETRANLDMAHIYNNLIWQNYFSFFQQADGLSSETIKSHPITQKLDAEIHRMMQNTHVIRLKIYSPTGKTIYSTAFDQIGENALDDPGFKSALNGEVLSSLSLKDRPEESFEDEAGEHDFVTSYIPVKDQKSGQVNGVVEVYTDVSDLIAQFSSVQWRTSTFTIGGLSVLLFWVLFSIRRADEALRKQEIKAREHKEHVLELLQHAYHDSLTGLPNRKSFKSHMADAVVRASRTKSNLAVFFLDLDGFKLVNDSMGHAQGDEVLRLVAKRLQGCIRESDTLFRMGGDEFCIVHEHLVDKHDAIPLIRRIHGIMVEPFEIGQQMAMLGVSIGVAIYPHDSTDPEILLRDADAAMYAAKEAGRNQYSFFSQEMNERAMRQLNFESSLLQALDNSEFILHYQPRIEVKHPDKVAGVEALIRWQQKDGTIVTPNEFIPVLERTGLIIQVGEWVLIEACRQNKAWQEQGLSPVRVSVNISFVQFQSGELVETVRKALSASQLEPRYLELELTESILIDASDANREILNDLKALGVSIAIDDFGTGYSSLGYLKSFPIDYIKIDRSFISDLPDDTRDAAITRAIASMAQELGIELVAEGVETQANLNFLTGQNCQELQGFLISHPLSAVEMSSYLSRQKETV